MSDILNPTRIFVVHIYILSNQLNSIYEIGNERCFSAKITVEILKVSSGKSKRCTTEE
ncbi:hypothetical protein MARI151_30666 [Maribacter litoralis]|uniref:Uncharacterized protein n=1 Tax=Maribacter litoralis TaxID=2059726 RepID=A0A653TWW0_9FLAO|nr:hypothetical protein MARI151_30666 [Maribacter litoralis]